VTIIRLRARSISGWLASLCLLVASCDSPTGPTPAPEPTELRLSQAALSLDDGARASLSATLLDASGAPVAVGAGQLAWSSRDPAIATVTDGTVVAVHPGRTEISATVAGLRAAAQLTVRAVPVALVSVKGDSLRGVAGQGLADSIVVRVLDRHQEGVPGASVELAVTAGGGSVSPAGATSDSAGYVRAAWTLGTTAGLQRVDARVTGSTVPSLAVVATATAASAVTLEKTGGDAQADTVLATLPRPLVVKATDLNGNPVAGALVAWTLGSDAGTVSPSITRTDSAGEARSVWTLGRRVGVQEAAVSSAGRTLRFTATATLGRIASLQLTPDSLLLSYPRSGTFHPLARDASGAALPEPSCTWSSSDARVAVVSATGEASTVADGRATITALCGNARVSAPVRVTESFVRLRLVEGDRQGGTAGRPLASRLVAQVIDSQNRAVPGAPLRWTTSTPGATLSDSVTLTDSVGVGSVVFTAGPVEGTQGATVTAGNATATLVFTVRAGPPARITIGTDTVLSLQHLAAPELPVRVFDAVGNRIGITVAYTNSDTTVARLEIVRDSIRITTRRAGTTLITARVDTLVTRLHLTVTNPPRIAWTAPRADTVINAPFIPIGVTAFGESVRIGLSLDGGAETTEGLQASSPEGAKTLTGSLEGLSAGQHVVRARAYDPLTGAVLAEDTRRVTLQFQARRYSLTFLGTLGGPDSDALDLNESGDIVGSSATAAGETHAVLWRNGALTDIGTGLGTNSVAVSMSGSAKALINFTFPDVCGARALVWEAGATMNIRGCGIFTRDVSGNGTVVAFGPNFGAKLLTRDTNYELGEKNTNFESRLNDAAWLVETSSAGTSIAQAPWASPSVRRVTSRELTSLSVSDRGDIAGSCGGGAPSCLDAFFSDGSSSRLELETYRTATVAAINASRQVIANRFTLGLSRWGFLWDGGQVYPIEATDAGWVVDHVAAMDERGRIVGHAVNSVTGQKGAVLLTPAP
jgi:probable HAF family extracellular repeat protein